MPTYTLFHDMSTGHQGRKTNHEYILINLPMYLAIPEFKHQFGVDPELHSCHCCGPDFSIYEIDEQELIEYYDEDKFFFHFVNFPKQERSLL